MKATRAWDGTQVVVVFRSWLLAEDARMNSSQFVWSEPSGAGRNRFCLFRWEGVWETMPEVARLEIFADSLYRLRVNGEVAGYGPARFVPSHPAYDSYDLMSRFRPGLNEILVEVNTRGSKSYQGQLSRGGFISAGEILWKNGQRLELGTPGSWKVLESNAWDRQAEPFSFAQAAIEIVDQGTLKDELDRGGWIEPCVLPEHPWGALTPRSLAMPSMEVVKPASMVAAHRLRNGSCRHGFRAPFDYSTDSGKPIKRMPFFTHIWSPIDQVCDFGVFWGPAYLNGVRMETERCTMRGNRDNGAVHLKAGWNLFYAAPELLKPFWPWLLEFPANRGLKICGLPTDEGGAEFYYREPLDDLISEPAPATLEDIRDFPGKWFPAAIGASSPAREMAWDVLGESLALAGGKWEFRSGGDAFHGATAIFDFGTEYLGHVRFRVQSEPGTIIDVAYDERLHKSGRLDHFGSNPFTNTADRFITAGGEECIEGYHERGGRYLQITVRESTGPVTLSELGIRKTVGNYPEVGTFRCSDPLFNWVWETGVRTLQASMADGWIDPWRERGMYLGDSLVEAGATRCFTSDWRMEKWALRVWSQAQLSSGQMPPAAPSDFDEAGVLPDFSLLYVVMLRNAWAATGDVILVKNLWSTVERILSSSLWISGPNGLWNLEKTGVGAFIDWGAPTAARKGTNACLNAFRIMALEAAAELGQRIGYRSEWKKEAVELREIFHEAFWNGAEGRYLASLEYPETPSWHATTLALLLGIPQGEDAERCWRYIRRTVKDEICSSRGGGLELYFLYYALQAMARAGREELAEDTIRSFYDIMRSRGAVTFWESIHMGLAHQGSVCHAWSCSPMIYFQSALLGYRLTIPGNIHEITIAPVAATVTAAEGRVPHPDGVVAIRWSALGRSFILDVSAPTTVTCQVDLSYWRGYEHEVTINGCRMDIKNVGEYEMTALPV